MTDRTATAAHRTVWRVTDYPVVPILTVSDLASCEETARALVDGGLPCVEVTLRTSVGLEAVRRMSRIDGLLVGAGTVTTIAQADAAIDAGAEFVITPGFSASIVATCRDRSVPVIPGVSTATEIMAALDNGLTTVKFFPAEALGGVATIKALSAPFPDLSFMATGGVSVTNMSDYLRIPSVVSVGASWLTAPALVRDGRFDEVSSLVRKAVVLASQSRAAIDGSVAR